MTHSNICLKTLMIEGFRGFRDSACFNLNASAIILAGPNGTGKTSVFDALQWVLLGSIDRLKGLRSRRNVEYIVNRYQLDKKADVSLVIAIHDKDKKVTREVTLLRRGDHKDSLLEIQGAHESPLSGDAAEKWLKTTLVSPEYETLKMALTTCGLLEQDVMRSVLEAKPAERYAHISAVLGLSDLEGFERATQDATKTVSERHQAKKQEVMKANRAVDDAVARLETIEQRASRRSSVEVARSMLHRVLEELPAELTFDVPESASADEAVALAQESRRFSRRTTNLLSVSESLHQQRQLLLPKPTSEQLEQLSLAATESAEGQTAARQELHRKQELLSAAEKASQQMARLAAAAIPLLSEECPVCGQAIDPEQVELHLNEIAGETSSLVERRHAVEVATRDIRTWASRIKQAENEQSAAHELSQRWECLREDEAALATDLTNFTSSSANGIAIENLEREVFDLIGKSIVTAFDDIAVALERYSDAVRESHDSSEIDCARSALFRAQEQLEKCQEHADRASKRALQFKDLANASTRARVDVVAERFKAIEPLITDIYSRLDPHPAFKGIGFKHDTYYGKGTSNPVVSDLSEKIEAEPLIVLSSSQANIVALACFLAMSLAAGNRALPFVLLDDPLQSMDDVNVLGFADLCRFLRSKRQLIVSTHDKRFANLLERKLSPRRENDRTIVHKFNGWDRRGPAVNSESLIYKPRNAEMRLLTGSA